MTLSPLYSKSHIFKPLKSDFQTEASHKVQLYLDYDCRFSSKIFIKLNEEVIPQIEKKYPGNFEFILMNVPQPWHPTGALMHEVALAVGKLQPHNFWEFSNILFKNQEKFFDTETYKKTRLDIYNELIKLAEDNFDINGEDILNLVKIEDSKEPSNSGNKISKDLKYFVRYQRTVGVHVTPTVAVDGIINGSIESSKPASTIVEILEGYL